MIVRLVCWNPLDHFVHVFSGPHGSRCETGPLQHHRATQHGTILLTSVLLPWKQLQHCCYGNCNSADVMETVTVLLPLTLQHSVESTRRRYFMSHFVPMTQRKLLFHMSIHENNHATCVNIKEHIYFGSSVWK